MASTEISTKDTLEGWTKENKKLEMVGKHSQLMAIQKEIKNVETKTSKQLTELEEELANTQAKLNDCNQDFVIQQRKLDELKGKQKVTLSVDHKQQVTSTTKETIEHFLVKRKAREDEERETQHVDVHFLPGNETIGANLHIGGEGAGSRDAKFTVKLDQKVESLSRQAAKYWGLDANKVFFLDRDGRIVPDKMLLSDVILPPVASDPPATASGASGAAASTALATIPEIGGAVEVHKKEAWKVARKNYTLTLVRATTVLDKEDLNKPKGIEWDDFTFSKTDLYQELEATRKKRAGPGADNNNPQNLDAIPSLYDLIQAGLLKKQKKRMDTNCRLAEFWMFLLAQLAFYFAVVQPHSNWVYMMRLASTSVDHSFQEFNNLELAEFGLQNYSQINSEPEYFYWLNGPFKRSVVGQRMTNGEMYVIGVIGFQYETMVSKLDGIAFCGDSGAISATNQSNMTTNVSDSTPAPTPQARRLDDETCKDKSLEDCTTEYAVDIYQKALDKGFDVPPCQTPYHMSTLEAYVLSFLDDPFAYVMGYIKPYSTDTWMTFNISNETSFTQAVDEFISNKEILTPARMLVSFIYVPSLNGLIVKKLLAEKTLSGAFVTSTKANLIDLDTQDALISTCFPITILFAIVCLLMELRRILGWPQCGVEIDGVEKCNWITMGFILLPCVAILGFSVYLTRFELGADELITFNADNQITRETIQNFYDCEVMDKYFLATNLVTLVMFNVLFFRYLLMYFPALIHLTKMVRNVLKPLFYLLLLLTLFLIGYGTIFYAIYSVKVHRFRNGLSTTISLIRFALGGIDWAPLAANYQFVFALLMVVGLIMLQLVLGALPVAIMVSHKKEKDLYENYSYHPFWQSERSKEGKNPEEFNPATIGMNKEEVERIEKAARRMDKGH